MENELDLELQKLAEESGYDSIRIFIAPDKTVSTQSIKEDMIEFFKALKTGKGFKTLFSVKAD